MRQETAMQTPSRDEADDIRRRMKQLRREANEDVEQFVESARTLGDWKQYVRAYPWVSLGVCAVAGYMLVPTRTNVVRPDASALIKLAKDEKLVVAPSGHEPKQSGFGTTIMTLAANALMRSVIAYVGQNAGKWIGTSAAEHDEVQATGRRR